MSMNLTDACRLRSKELTRELAGCLAIDPIYIAPLLEKLKPEALTDANARRFIGAIKDKFQLLQDATDDKQADIIVQIASENHLLSEYCQWITLPYNLYRDGPAAIRELQAIAITIHEIENLQGWIKAQENYINGR